MRGGWITDDELHEMLGEIFDKIDGQQTQAAKGNLLSRGYIEEKRATTDADFVAIQSRGTILLPDRVYKMLRLVGNPLRRYENDDDPWGGIGGKIRKLLTLVKPQRVLGTAHREEETP